MFSGSILSDHFPLCFHSLPLLCSLPYFFYLRLDWHKASTSDIQKYRDMVSLNLFVLSSEAMNCYSTDCSCHLELLDDYAHHLVHTLLDCACLCIPSHTTSSPRRLVGWKDGVSSLKEATNFCHKVWVEAGCPSSGVLFSIKKNAKSRYKYAHRRLKRRQHFPLQKKLACSFAGKSKEEFWSDIKQLNKPSKSSRVPVVDGVSGCGNIARIKIRRYVEYTLLCFS